MRNAALVPDSSEKEPAKQQKIADRRYKDIIALLWSPTGLRRLTFDP